MNSYDMMIIGPATRDVNIDYTGAEDRCVGGAVTFCTPAARATGARVFAAVKANPEDRDVLKPLGGDPADAALLPSARTTLMRNEYFTADRERRNSSCPAQSDPVLPEEIPDVPCRLYHLAGLLYGDFPDALIEKLHQLGLVSADAQGFLRHNENGTLCFRDWEKKLKYLPYMDFLKTDAAEAEILTGLTDRAAAARSMNGAPRRSSSPTTARSWPMTVSGTAPAPLRPGTSPAAPAGATPPSGPTWPCGCWARTWREPCCMPPPASL